MVARTTPETLRRQSWWALALALPPLLVTQVAAVTLTVLVLAERDGETRRTTPARAAVAVMTFWVLLAAFGLVLALVLAPSDEDDDATRWATWQSDGTLDVQGAVPVAQLRPGDCFSPLPSDGVLLADVVRCTTSHDAEVFHVFTLPEGPYPGDDDVRRLARGTCWSAFEAWVGVPWADSALEFAFDLPTQTSWDQRRDVTCYLTTYSPVTEQLQGSAR